MLHTSPAYVSAQGHVSVSDLWTNWAVPESKFAGFYSADKPLPRTQAGLLDDLHLCVNELVTDVCLSVNPEDDYDPLHPNEFIDKAVVIADALFALPASKSSRRPLPGLTRKRVTFPDNDPASKYDDATETRDVAGLPDSVAGLLRYLHSSCEEWLIAVGDYRSDLNRGAKVDANASRNAAGAYLNDVRAAITKIRAIRLH
jgi:hypothetical protein